VGAGGDGGDEGDGVKYVGASFTANRKVFTLMSLNEISVTNLSLPYPTLSNKSVKSVF